MTTSSTAGEPIIRIRDNPLLVAQARRRTRRAEVRSSAIILALIGIFSTLIAFVSEADAGDGWVGLRFFYLAVMVALLYVRGPALTAAAVHEERHSGILDFHRATPTTAWTDAAGYLFGCCAREWLLCALLLPFWLISVVMSGQSLGAAVVSLAYLAFGSLIYQALGLWFGMTANSRRTVSSGIAAVLFAAVMGGLVLFGMGVKTPLFLTPVPLIASLEPHWAENAFVVAGAPFFGMRIHPAIFTLVVQGHALAFLLLAVVRKLRRDDAPSFSRTGAMAFFATVSILMLGGSWDVLDASGTELLVAARTGVTLLAACYLLASTAVIIVILMGLSPPHLEFVRAMRRARHDGRPDAGWRDEGGSTLLLIPPFAVMMLAGLLAIIAGARDIIPLADMLGIHTWFATGCSIALIAFASGAVEHARLSLRSSYKSGAVLTAFIAVIVPWMVAGVVQLSAGDSGLSMLISSFSPIYAGIAVLSAVEHWPSGGVQHDLPINMLISVVVSSGAAAWFYWRIVAFRAEAARRVPLGARRSRPTPPSAG